jgi:hypothetical protein
MALHLQCRGDKDKKNKALEKCAREVDGNRIKYTIFYPPSTILETLCFLAQVLFSIPTHYTVRGQETSGVSRDMFRKYHGYK